ncbi:MAG: ATP-binding protein [Pirellulales bacterium]|jgi:signal transduction histidine kinase|nr:ATP-binding protein [Pirellulales bacterium]
MWKKVVTPPILVSILWIAGSSITNYYIQGVYESHARALEENVATIRAGWAMQDALWRLESIVMEAEGRDLHEAGSEADELKSVFLQHLDDAERTSVTPEEQVLVRAVRERFAVYRDHVGFDAVDPGDGPPQADRLAQPAWQPVQKEATIRLAREVARLCRRLTDLNERILAEATARSVRLGRVMHSVHLTFLIAGPIVGVLCGLWVARGLRRSLSEISVTLRDAAGDLDRKVGSVEVRALDDLPALQQQVEAVAEQIRRVMDELERSRQKAMLTERLAAVGELATGVAHELRNPLTSVKLLIQTAAKREGPAAIEEKPLQVARQEIARMESVIQGLLDFARPPQLRRVPHDLRETVRRALNLVAGHASRQQVRVLEEFPAEPVVVDGDPDQLHQVFVNLALNGIEAMEEGGPMLVSISSGAALGGRQVVFRDRGPGIPQEIIGRIFEPFVTSKQRGTGLGLAISRRIVEDHGGALHAANRAEGGAMFTVDLPPCEPQPEAADAQDSGD